VADFSTSIDIDAPAEVVYEHLVTVEGLLAWMGQHAELHAAPGGEFSVDINGAAIRGRYLELERPRRVVVSWGMAGSDDFPPGSSQVEFVLTAHGDGTRLDLHHTGLPDGRRDGYSTGWLHFLAQLQKITTERRRDGTAASSPEARPDIDAQR